MDNLFLYILSQKMIAALPSAGKDAILRKLYKNRIEIVLVKIALRELNKPENERAFAPENDAFPPTLDTTELKNFISTNGELCDILRATFNRLNKPKWMMNMLPYILTKEKLIEIVGLD